MPYERTVIGSLKPELDKKSIFEPVSEYYKDLAIFSNVGSTSTDMEASIVEYCTVGGGGGGIQYRYEHE